MNSFKTRLAASVVAILVSSLGVATHSFAFNSGDVPAPVDDVEMNGPGRSHLNDSGISGFDGNQGNDKQVGNAGGRPSAPPVGGDDGGEEEPPEGPILQ